MWNDVIELGNMQEEVIHGEPIQTMVYREVFANKKSVKQTEFYQAASVGLKPELIFEIRLLEFENDKKIRYSGKEYSIVRIYEKGENIELTVSSYTGSEV